jgi:hypothetical protein
MIVWDMKSRRTKMSNTINTMILENLFDEVLDQDKKGLLDDDIKDIAREQGLDIYHDRYEILEIITNIIFECKYD